MEFNMKSTNLRKFIKTEIKRIITEELDRESINRMSGMLSESDKSNFTKSVKNMSKVLLDDGFDIEDIREFLMMRIDDELSFM